MADQLKVEEIRQRIADGALEPELRELLDAETALPEADRRKTAIAALEERLDEIAAGRAMASKRFEADPGSEYAATDSVSSAKVVVAFGEDGTYTTDDEAEIRVLTETFGLTPKEA